MKDVLHLDSLPQSEFKYHQLAHTLQCAIIDGLYEPGEKLPSIRKIANSYNVSITTVKQALDLLVSQDCIAPQARSGFFVVKNPGETNLVEPDHDLVEALIDECCVPRNDTIDSSLVFAVLPSSFTPKKLIEKSLVELAKEQHPLLYEYANFEHTAEVRLILSRYAMESGVTLDPKEIVFADGFLQALESSLILLNPQRKPVAIESPTNFAFIQVLQNLGMPIVPLSLESQHDGEVEFDFDSFEARVLQKEIAILILSTSVRNPLGLGVSRGQRKKIAHLLDRTDLILFEDDTLRDTVTQPLPPIYSLTQSKRVLWFSSFAETLSPTLKFCWIAAGSFHQLLREKWRSTGCAISGIQLALIEKLLLTSGFHKKRQEILEQNLLALHQARDYLLHSFPTGTKIAKPIGGFSLWVQLPKEVSGLDLYRKAKLLGFSFVPGIAFSLFQQHGTYIRIAPGDFSTKSQQLLHQTSKLVTEILKNHSSNEEDRNTKENQNETCTCDSYTRVTRNSECCSKSI